MHKKEQTMKIGIIANTQRDIDLKVTKAILEKVSKTEEAVLAAKHKGEISGVNFLEGDEFYASRDLLLVLGGDGTLLEAARHAAPFGTPVLGINLGHVGFLSGAEKEDFMEGDISAVLKSLRIENRMMLTASVEREGEVIATFFGLNDAVIRGVVTESLLRMQVTANEEMLETYVSDGIVFATPTGSTAYSFAAGGAVVHPGMEALLVTPICPHMLHARPVVLSGDSVLKATFSPDSASAYLNVDGEDCLALEKGDTVKICKAPYSAKIATLKKHAFLEILKDKLKG